MKKLLPLTTLLVLLLCVGCQTEEDTFSAPQVSRENESSCLHAWGESSEEEISLPGEIVLPTESDGSTEESDSQNPDVMPLSAALAFLFQEEEKQLELVEFGVFLEEQLGDERADALSAAFLTHGYNDSLWREFTGNSLHVWESLFRREPELSPYVKLMSMGETGSSKSTVMTFGGDICFADNYVVMQHLKTTQNGLADCIAPEWFRTMQDADIAVMNNEFCISDRGTPMNGKVFTFRADPAHTALYNRLGVDLVTLANNHAYDYGKDAFLDTMEHLRAHGVSYVGGGKNAEEAQHPVYYLVDGRKIAFVSATRAEKFILTPEAKENSPGVFRCYDTARLLEVIAEAKAQSDYVVLLVHWGKEGYHELEDVMVETARDYVAAGADLIVGAHAHRLQGIEFVDGKAVFYNLGNFWFDNYDIEVGLLKFELTASGEERFYFLPGMQSHCTTSYELGTDVGRSILDHLELYSDGKIRIEDDGRILEQ